MDNQGRGGRGPSYSYTQRGRGGRGSYSYNRNKQNSFRNNANTDYRPRQSESEHPPSNEVQETTEMTDSSQRSHYGRNTEPRNSESRNQEPRGRGNRGSGGGTRRIQGGRRRQSSSDTRPYQKMNRQRTESQSSSSSAKVTESKVDLKTITPSCEEEEKEMLKLAIEASKKFADEQKAFYAEIGQVDQQSTLSDSESSNFDVLEEARKIKAYNDFPPLPSTETHEVVLKLLPETNGTQGSVQLELKPEPSGADPIGKDWTLYGAKPKGTVSVPRVPTGRGTTKSSFDGCASSQFGSFINSKSASPVSVHQKATEKTSENCKPISLIKKPVSEENVVSKIVPEVISEKVETPVLKENVKIDSLTEQFEDVNIDQVSKPNSISTIVGTFSTHVLATTSTETQSSVIEGRQREELPVIRPQSSPLLETPLNHSQIDRGIDSNAVPRPHQPDYSIEICERDMMAQNVLDDGEQRCVELELKANDPEEISSQNTQPAGISQIIVPYPTMIPYPGIVYQIGYPSPYFPHVKPAIFPYQNAPPTVISTVDGQLIQTAPIPQHLPVDFGGFIPRFVAPRQTMEPPPMENDVDPLQVDYQSSIVSQSQLSVNAVPFSPRETPRTHAPSYYSKPKGSRSGHYGPGHQRNYNTGYQNPRNGYGNYSRPPHRHPFPSRNYPDYGMNPLQHSEIQTQEVPNENPQFYGGANFYQYGPYQRQDYR